MFTGLVETIGVLKKREILGKSGRISVQVSIPLDSIAIGDSIAINGVCLTLEKKKSTILVFHTLSETLKKTNLGDIPLGGIVNVERALCLGDRLGGHIVSGHVDAVSKIMDIKNIDGDYVLTIFIPKGYEGQLIEKGSVAIDGISLTIVSLSKASFSVHLIPHTWKNTSLSQKKKGDSVNIETDLIGKYIQRNMKLTGHSSSINMNTLLDAGFLD